MEYVCKITRAITQTSRLETLCSFEKLRVPRFSVKCSVVLLQSAAQDREPSYHTLFIFWNEAPRLFASADFYCRTALATFGFQNTNAHSVLNVNMAKNNVGRCIFLEKVLTVCKRFKPEKDSIIPERNIFPRLLRTIPNGYPAMESHMRYITMPLPRHRNDIIMCAQNIMINTITER